jgi:hypothetical protein
MKPLWLAFPLLALFLIAPYSGSAQIENSPIMQALSVSVRPEYPKPNEVVEISIQSSALDLNAASIRWQVNGVTEREGIGERRFSFVTGPLGSVSSVVVAITPFDKPAFSREFTFYPAEVDIVWEAYTYTPPFYKGKASFTEESVVRLSALPRIINSNGELVPASNLTYRWLVNDKVLSGSGYGKSSVGIQGSRWDNEEIVQVEVTTRDGAIKTVGEITLRPEKPLVALYEESPTLGTLWNRAIQGNFTLKNSEVSFLAVPYHFVSSQLERGTQFVWSINGREVPNEGSGNLITLRNDSGSQGQTNVGLDVRQESNLSQFGEASFSIYYEN